MNKTIAMALASLSLAACGMAVTAAVAQVDPDQPFSLSPGQTASTRDGRLQVGFEAVTADSRCPKGEQCIRAGEAVVQLWVQAGAGPKTRHELMVTAGAEPSVRLPDHDLRVERLDPYPARGRPIDARDYVATMVLARRPGAVPR